jgi:hypothetical protein
MSEPGEQLANADERGDNEPARLEAAAAASSAGAAASDITEVSHGSGWQAPVADAAESVGAGPAVRRQPSEGS